MLIAVLLLSALLVSSGQLDPAEIGKDYTMTVLFNHTINEQLKVSLYRHTSPISRCELKKCKDYFAEEIVTTLKHIAGREYEFKATFNKILLRDEATWKLSYLGPAQLHHPEPLFLSFLKLFSKGEIKNCTSEIYGKNLRTGCNLTIIYPQAKSELRLLSEGLIITFHMKCSNIREHDPNFNSYCEGSIPVSQFKGDIEIFFYPNVTGDKIDTKLGKKQKFEATIVYLQNCPDVVIEGSSLLCDCKILSNRQVQSTFAWFDENRTMYGNGNLTLTYLATRHASAYTCRSIPDNISEHWKNVFKPQIICFICSAAKYRNLTCSVTLEQAKCWTENVLSKGKCLFSAHNKERKVIHTTATDEYVFHGDGTRTNQTICCFNLSGYDILTWTDNFTAIIYTDGEMNDANQNSEVMVDFTTLGEIDYFINDSNELSHSDDYTIAIASFTISIYNDIDEVIRVNLRNEQNHIYENQKHFEEFLHQHDTGYITAIDTPIDQLETGYTTGIETEIYRHETGYATICETPIYQHETGYATIIATHTDQLKIAYSIIDHTD